MPSTKRLDTVNCTLISKQVGKKWLSILIVANRVADRSSWV